MEIENASKKSGAEMALEIIKKLPADRVSEAVNPCKHCECVLCLSCRNCCDGMGKGRDCPDWLPWW